MKKLTSTFAIFVITAMVVTSAFAQSSGGAAGGASGSGGVSSPSTSGAASSTSTPGPSNPSTPGSGADAGGGDAKSKAEKGAAGSPSASPSTTTAASGDFTGRHTMEGEVVSVDQKKGHLKLKTAEGNMDLHFPPSALANVKKGDRISVELAMKPAGSASLPNDKDAKGSASPKTEKK